MKSRYKSIDALQKELAKGAFAYAADPKKAAGRALGTFVELITFYLLKSWGLEQYLAIERGLPEFANPSVAHNVEFTLHRSHHVADVEFEKEITLSAKKLMRSEELASHANNGKITTNVLIGKDGLLKNACTIFENQTQFINAYCKTQKKGCPTAASAFELSGHPFAMFECKRVGVEEGQKKGPQTIEKAKQGAYVARTVSSLQRVRLQNGSIAGFLERPDGTFICEEYYSLLKRIMSGDNKQLIKDFTLTVGVVSNHGNWFTAENKNKELEVLAQSYDWLLFLTDEGLAAFINDVLHPRSSHLYNCSKAFHDSYSAKKCGNRFTKSKIDTLANAELTDYFTKHAREITGWFNVITPRTAKISELRSQLFHLVAQEGES